MIVRIQILGDNVLELFSTEELNGLNAALLSFVRNDGSTSIVLDVFWRDQCDLELPSWLLGAMNHYGKSLRISCHEEPEPEFKECSQGSDGWYIN